MKPGVAASLTIVHALAGTDNLYVNFNGLRLTDGTYFSDLQTLTYGFAQNFGGYSGSQQIGISRPSDTASQNKHLLLLNLDLALNSMQTLFIAGSAAFPDTVLSNDVLPYQAQNDSTVGVRFVNLSVNNPTIDIGLGGNMINSEQSMLPYKALTAYALHSLRSSQASYVFEFRDHESGELLGSCVVDEQQRSKNLTLILLPQPEIFFGSRVVITGN